MAEFRVKAAGGSLDDKAPVATVQVGQASAVYRHRDNLVVLRQVIEPDGSKAWTEAVIFDFADPARPRQVSRLTVPFQSSSYYGYRCGVGLGYWFGEGERTIVTRSGLAQVRHDYRDGLKLAFLDLNDPAHPSVSEADLKVDSWGKVSLVADPDSDGFYLAHRSAIEEERGSVFTRYRVFAQRWQPGAQGLVAGEDINLPGTLARTWLDNGTRRFLTHDRAYRAISMGDHYEAHVDSRLHLLRQVGVKAELLDGRTFVDLRLGSLLLDDGRLFVGAQRSVWGAEDPGGKPPGWEETSDRLMIIDLRAGSLQSVYDQPTRTYGVDLMGLQEGNLFLHLPGDGVLVTDVSDLADPRGIKFLRTLGQATHTSSSGMRPVASGNFGVFNFDLGAPSDIPVQ